VLADDIVRLGVHPLTKAQSLSGAHIDHDRRAVRIEESNLLNYVEFLCSPRRYHRQEGSAFRQGGFSLIFWLNQ
jgi:hypothetical protein